MIIIITIIITKVEKCLKSGPFYFPLSRPMISSCFFILWQKKCYLNVFWWPTYVSRFRNMPKAGSNASYTWCKKHVVSSKLCWGISGVLQEVSTSFIHNNIKDFLWLKTIQKNWFVFYTWQKFTQCNYGVISRLPKFKLLFATLLLCSNYRDI